jgi:methenyltetrahydrofolate cyclohydrolase
VANAPPDGSSLVKWCEAIAGPSVSPGGGSAAAIAAGLAAAVLQMVAGLTGVREKYADVHAQARETETRAAELRQRLLGLAVHDAEVLDELTSVLAKSQESDAQRAARAAARRMVLHQAASVQFDLLGCAVEAIDLAVVMAESGLASALGDSATAGFLAAAAARSAFWAIRSDLHAAGSDPESTSRLALALTLLERAEAAELRLREILSERMR